jgi:cytochrome c-type biogenesis protein CcmH/NrfG
MSAPPRPLSVKLSILEARNVSGLAGPGAAFNAFAHVVLRGEPIDTPVVPPSADAGVHRFDGHAKVLEFADLTPLLLNELVAQPLTFGVSQVEGKQAEKTLLATGQLYLDPLLRAERLEVLVPLALVGAAADKAGAAAADDAAAAPALLVLIELSAALVEPADLDPDDGLLRILELRLDGVVSLPRNWQLAPDADADSNPYVYRAVTAIPLGEGAQYLLAFNDGVLTKPAPPAAADADVDDALAAAPPSGEQLIVWPAPSAEAPAARVILTGAAVLYLRARLDASALSLRLSRAPRKADVVEPAANVAKWAALCSARLDALVTLDATEACAECALEPEFPPDEEAAAAAAAAAAEATAAAEAGAKPKDGKGGAAKKDADAKAKGGAAAKGGKAVAPTELPLEDPEFPHPFTVAGTTLLLSASADRPLFPRPPPPPPPVPTVAQLVPKRVLPALLPKSADAEFEVQVRAAVASLLDEFARLFGAEPLGDDSAGAREARRRALLYQLNNSGGYFAIKERLKKAVVRIVRESFHRTDESQLPPGAESDRFYSELYVHLVRLAHRTLHEAFFPPKGKGTGAAELAAADGGGKAVGAAMGRAGGALGAGRPRAPIVPTSEPRLVQLRRLADEMECEREWAAAAAFHEERLCVAENDGALWLEYGRFLLRAHELPRAEAALREAISIMPDESGLLTAYAATLFCAAKVDDAEVRPRTPRVRCARPREDGHKRASERASGLACAPCGAPCSRLFQSAAAAAAALAQPFFKAVVDRDSQSALAWAALATVYDAQGRQLDGKRAYKTAQALAAEPHSLHLQLAESLVPYCAEALVEKALELHAAAVEPARAADDARVRLCRARARAAAHKHEEAAELLYPLVAAAPGRAELQTELGDALLCDGQAARALDAYAAALKAAPDAPNAALHLRYSQLTARVAEAAPPGPVQQATWARARDAALRACKHGPSATSWLAVGVACAALNSLAEAEEALSEACVLNNRSARVWAHLALLTLRLDRRAEAEQVRAWTASERAPAAPRWASRTRRPLSSCPPSAG